MHRAPIRVALIGATGYTGAEALRLLIAHPGVELVALCGHSKAGLPLGEVLPPFIGVDAPPITRFDAKAIAAIAEFAILALPHGTAQEAAAQLLGLGVRVIDLSADHRFDDPAFYDQIYPTPHAHPETLEQTVYGLVELNRARIREARIVGCAGCYPTSVILAALPAFDAQLVEDNALIADCKSGVSGAGRKVSAGTHYAETADGMRAYKTLSHRHGPEIGRALGGAKVHFAPHLVPMIRGILSTVYIRLKAGVTAARVREIYTERYADEPFVTVLDEGGYPATSNVKGTNRVHLALFVDDGLLVVQVVIDNLTKGSSGQALQVLNLMAGLPETTGLMQTALFP